MKCIRCGKEMKNIGVGEYMCDCGWGSGGSCSINQDDWSYQPTFTRPESQNIVYGPKIEWRQQGWICPKCGAVLSPSTMCCPFCSPTQEVKVTYGTSTGDFDLNLYLKTISEDKNNG